MTKERKQELRQLLARAMGSLLIRYRFGGPSIPVDVYRKYLQEHWTYYRIDFLSSASSIHFVPDIADGPTKSNLLDYIRGELALFINPDLGGIQTASYFIKSDSTHEDRLYTCASSLSLPLFIVMERLLEIALVRGIEAAISFFDQCSRPEGTHAFLRDVGLLEGVKLETEVEVFEGVRLVPLPSREISWEVEQCLFRFPIHVLNDQVDSLFEKTLLVIDQPGFSMLCKASEEVIQNGTRIDDLPFQVEVHKVKFPNVDAVDSFQTLFCQALSLVCDSPVQIFIGFYSLEEDKSFNLPHGGSSMRRQGNPLGTPTEVKEADIEKAKCLYERLVDLDSNDREKLQIPIDRWVASKTSKSWIDKIIDLGIAFEALYVPDSGGDITYKFSIRAARYLGKDKEDRNKLLQKFKQIYNHRSNAVHSGKLDERVRFGEERIPISEFIQRAQNLCRESIMKVLEDRKLPNWNSLILGGEDEQASS